MVSVIVPLYNKARYVARALDSIAAQTCTDFEAIVVDDGSTDGGAEIAAARADARFRVLRQANAGPGAARNRGISEARGSLLAFLDADDLWDPEYLENAVRTLDLQARAAAVTCGYRDSPGGSTEAGWRERKIPEGVYRVSAATPPPLFAFMLAYMSPCTTVARREAVKRWGGFHERDGCRFAEDAMLWLKVLLHEEVCFDLRPLASFDRSASGLSGNLGKARPVEPFLLDPGEVNRICPPELRPLLAHLYAIRAFKTALTLGSWHDWRRAAGLLRRFVRPRDFRYIPAAVRPLGGWTGFAVRAWSAQHRRPADRAASSGK